MIYGSREPASLNKDPRPYRNRYDGSRWKDDGGDPWLLPYKPREGFTPLLSHDPNPILVAFRARESATNKFALIQWVGFLRRGWDSSICEANKHERAHALKVLSRLLDAHF